jgi:phosphoribosylpyrophosphate synthetase
MKVRYICGYYSDLAHKNKKRRPEDYWDALNFCWAVKVGKFKPKFNIHQNGKKIAINANNFALARQTFGEWIQKSVAKLGGQEATLVPVPSKDGLLAANSFRTLEMTKEALKDKDLAARVVAGLKWKEQLTKAHEGGSRNRKVLAPLLHVEGSVKGKQVILIDDLFSTGSSLLAAEEALTAAGCTVLGAITCGKTIYDLDTPHFGEQEFELTEELADWAGQVGD